MSSHRYACAKFVAGILLAGLISTANAQSSSDPIEFKIKQSTQRLTMYVNSSKILTLEGNQIPRALVNNTDLLKVVPLSPNQVQISALKPGVTQINIWDDNGEIYTIDVIIYGDAKELELLLETEFPTASLRVRPLATSVVLSGYVDRPDVVSRVIKMAEDYYPKVINNITVGGVQQVMLHVQVMEVSRTKLRALGFDWTNFGSSDFVSQHISGLIREVASNSGSVSGTGNSTITFGLIGPNNRFFGFVEALRQYDLVKVLAEPVLTTVSGRPASFNAGGEFPILIPQGLGTVAIEFKQFGTRVDFVPIVLGNGNIRLEVRPQVSEIDNARGVDLNGTRIPGLRTRWVDTAVEMRSGQTLALAGLIQNRVEAQNRGIPWLADLPWAGSLFRRVEEASNEIELLVMVRPELVDALDPHQVPACGPGEQTTSPNDVELYFRGYLEVPDCCKDGTCARCRPGVGVYGVPNVSLERGPTGGGEGDAAPTAEGTEYLPDAVEPPIAPPVFRGSEYRHRAQPTAEQRLLSASLLVASEPLPSPQETVRVVCFMTDSSGDRSSHDRRGGLVPVSESTLIDHEPRLFGQVGYDVLD